MRQPPRGNGNGNGRPGNGNGRPTRPDRPRTKPKTKRGRREFAGESLKKLLGDERRAGRRRPNRRAIERHMKIAEKFTDKQIQDAFVDLYDSLVEVGALNAR